MTREEALNAITAFVENYACGSDLDGLREAIEALKERPHGEWIPCSERLPEKNGVYLVTGENGHVFEYDYSDFTTHNEKWSYCRNEIVAWMPLPEPYKKEGEAE